jgi:hypothetical protein
VDRGPDQDPRPVVRARDDGLRRLARMRRWLVVASVGLAGALAAFVAQAKPGKSSTATAAQPAARSGPASRAQPSASGGGSIQLTPPTPVSPPPQAPLPAAPAAPAAPTVSGGS